MKRIGKRPGAMGDGSIATAGGSSARRAEQADGIDAIREVAQRKAMALRQQQEAEEKELDEEEFDISSIFGKKIENESSVKSSAEFQLKLASFIMRRGEEIRSTGGVAAQRGMTVIEETMKMMEHLYILQTEDADR